MKPRAVARGFTDLTPGAIRQPVTCRCRTAQRAPWSRPIPWLRPAHARRADSHPAPAAAATAARVSGRDPLRMHHPAMRVPLAQRPSRRPMPARQAQASERWAQGPHCPTPDAHPVPRVPGAARPSALRLLREAAGRALRPEPAQAWWLPAWEPPGATTQRLRPPPATRSPGKYWPAFRRPGLRWIDARSNSRTSRRRAEQSRQPLSRPRLSRLAVAQRRSLHAESWPHGLHPRHPRPCD